MKHRLDERPIHLGLGGTAEVQPAMTGMDWYGDYEARTAIDGADGRLVSQHRFTEDWDQWERHPVGEEVVLCVAGALKLHQQIDGDVRSVALDAGDYVVNPAGVWHTADVGEEALVLFVTPGRGTEHKPR